MENIKEVFTKDHENLCKLYASLSSVLKGYQTQAIRQGLITPSFTLKEFINWVIQQESFNELCTKWVESDFNSNQRLKMRLKSSGLDRYSLSNFILSSHEVEYRIYSEKKEQDKINEAQGA